MNKTEGKLRLSAAEVKQSYSIVSEKDGAEKTGRA
jgi:hypothetical protein